MSLSSCVDVQLPAIARPGPSGNRLTAALVAAVLLAALFSPGELAAGPLVAQWSFEEGPADVPATGPILDSSGNGHDGVAVNGPVYREALGGPSGLALDFNGVNQHVFIPDNPAFALTSEFTVEAWVYVRSFPETDSSSPIVVRGDTRPGINAFSLALEANRLVFSLEDADGNKGAVSMWFASLERWSRVVASYRAQDGQSFLDLLAEDFVNSAATDVQLLELLAPGFDPGIYIAGNDGEFFDGLIDDVKIYNRALIRNSITGDVTFDGAVGIDDLNLVRNYFGCDCGPGSPPGDANFDGVVNLDDLNIVRDHFGDRLDRHSAVPEPSGVGSALLAMLTVSAASLLRRLRKRTSC